VGTEADPASADGTDVSCPLGIGPVPGCHTAMRGELAPRATEPSKEKPVEPARPPRWVACTPHSTHSLSCANSCTCLVTQAAEMRGGKHNELLGHGGSLQKR